MVGNVFLRIALTLMALHDCRRSANVEKTDGLTRALLDFIIIGANARLQYFAV